MNKDVIGGADGERASARIAKSIRCVNDAVVSGQYINLSGEVSNRLKTDCVALRSVWLRTRMAGGVGAGGVNAPRYPI